MVRRERLGLVGRNGCGKSTLFKMVLGEEHPDEGTFTMPRDYRVGHLAQHLHFEEESIIKEVTLGLPPDERDEEYRAEILLSGLGFSEADMHRPASAFSGGFQIRINLARLLISAPNLLLLDEPTNYLDIVSARWLARFLQDWDDEVIIISHDRDFLNDVCTHTMLIHRGGIRKIAGSTDKLYQQVAVDEDVYEKTRVNEDKKRRDMEVFITRFRAQASKAAMVQSRVKALERMGRKDALDEEETLDFSFTQTQPFHGKYLIEVKDLSFAYQAEGSPLIKNLTFNAGPGERIGIIGKNGKGKSTLLRLLAGELKPQTGSVLLHQHARIGYFGQTNIERLSKKRTVEEEIGEANHQLLKTRLRNICGTMMFSGDDALKKVEVLSGGEKSRVLLGKILATQTNVLLLDEPTNHLDMESIEALVESAKGYEGTIIIVTHSEHILRALATKLIVFQGDAPIVLNDGYDYFLEKIGWKDEDGDAPTTTSPVATSPLKTSRVFDKAERAQLLAEKGRILKPLKAKLDDIEAQITRNETEFKLAEADLLRASEARDGKKIGELSKKIASCRQEIENLFLSLEAASKAHDSKVEEYKSMLGE